MDDEIEYVELRSQTPVWVKVLIPMVAMLTICFAITSYQLTRRNSSLDSIESSAVRTEAAVLNIERISKRFDKPEQQGQAEAFARLLRQIDEIYQATVPGADEGGG